MRVVTIIDGFICRTFEWPLRKNEATKSGSASEPPELFHEKASPSSESVLGNGVKSMDYLDRSQMQSFCLRQWSTWNRLQRGVDSTREGTRCKVAFRSSLSRSGFSPPSRAPMGKAALFDVAGIEGAELAHRLAYSWIKVFNEKNGQD